MKYEICNPNSTKIFIDALIIFYYLSHKEHTYYKLYNIMYVFTDKIASFIWTNSTLLIINLFNAINKNLKYYVNNIILLQKWMY